MDTKQILRRLTAEDIASLLVNYYGVDMLDEDNGEYYRFETCCHNPIGDDDNSHKLYLYKDSRYFFCYTGCMSLSLFDLVQTLNQCDFNEAVKFIEDYFHLGTVNTFGKRKSVALPTLVKRELKEIKVEEERLRAYDESILNTFSKVRPQEWLCEGITKETLDKFEIKMDIHSYAITIPHRDYWGNLVGIRVRNLDEYFIDVFGKYTPYKNHLNGTMYRHSIGKNLYGINRNKENIRRHKKAIIVESEKSVLKFEEFYPNENICVSMGGSSFSEYQCKLLELCGCEEVIFMFDLEYGEQWAKKIEKIYNKASRYFDVYTMNSTLIEKYLEEKESPMDKNKEIVDLLIRNRIKVRERVYV